MRKTFSYILAILALTASPAFALDMEYYTYGGFSAVVSAFTKIALIFSDTNYKALFFTVIAIGIMTGAATVYFMALGGARISPLSWAWAVGIGVTIYLALIIPKGRLQIYDPVRNQSQLVGGIPDGIVVVVGVLNKIERGLVDIVSTAADPVGYQGQAGGIGFDMLLNLHSSGVLLSDQYIHMSLKKYVEDCLFFELARPGTTLSINQLANNTDFIPLFRKAASPAIYTTFYEDAKPEGRTLKCSDAMPAIEAKINNGAFYDNTSKARCAEAGFDPTIPSEYNQCRSILTNLVSWLEGAAVSAIQLNRQTVVAQAINDVVLFSSPDTATRVLASRDAGTSMLATGVTANSWIPIIRTVITAIAIGLIPFLVIFIPTPLFGKAIGLIAGFFIWLTAWGITDAVVHQFAMDFAFKAFEEFRQNQLGMTAMATFGTASLKTLAAFGAIRWSGLMLATVITTMLVKFGGHALDTLAGQMTSTAHHAAESAGRVTTPEGKASVLRSVEESPPVMANASKYDFSDRIASRTNTMAKGVGEGLGFGDPDSSFAMGRTMGQSTRGSALGTEHFAKDVAGGDVVSASRDAQYLRQSSHYGGSKGRFDEAHQMFGLQTPSESAAFESTGRLITKDMAAFSASQGNKGVIPGMRLTDIGFDPKTGKANSMSFAGPVTDGNLDALRETASASGHTEPAAMIKPGMLAAYSIDPKSGKGTFSATDTTSVKSEGFGEKTFENGLTVDTPYGSYKFKKAKAQEVGGQMYINGVTEDGKAVSLEGSLRDAYQVIPGLKRGTDGTAHYSADPDAAMYELQMKPADHGGGGALRTSLMKDRNGEITGIGLNLTKGEIGGGVHGFETFNGNELKSLAKVLKSEGVTGQAVNTMEHLGEQGRSADVEYTYPAHGGEMGKFSVTNEKTGKTTDFAMSKSGWESVRSAHSSSLSGVSDVTEDINKSTVDHGKHVGSAMQMALDRDPAIARFVSDHATNKYKAETFNANVAATAKDLANDMGGYLHQNGASVSQAEGTVGLRVFGMGGSISKKSTGGETVNLLAAEYDRNIRQSVGEARAKGLGREDTEKYVAGKVGDFTQGLYDQARKYSSSDYGATAPVGAAEGAITRTMPEGDPVFHEQLKGMHPVYKELLKTDPTGPEN